MNTSYNKIYPTLIGIHIGKGYFLLVTTFPTRKTFLASVCTIAKWIYDLQCKCYIAEDPGTFQEGWHIHLTNISASLSRTNIFIYSFPRWSWSQQNHFFFTWIDYFLALTLPLGVLLASTPLFLISVGEAPLDFFCNGVALFAGFTPLK